MQKQANLIIILHNSHQTAVQILIPHKKYKIIRFTITKDENQNNLKILFLIELSIESDGNVYADSENSSNSSPLINL
jgi:hypothetical protein